MKKKLLVTLLMAGVLLFGIARAQEVAPSIRITEQRHETSFIQMPALVDMADAAVQATINQDIAQSLTLDQWMAKLGQLRAGATTETIEVECDGRIYGQILSLTVTVRGNIGAVETGEQVYGLNYALDTGKRLSLEDIFVNSDDAIARMETIATADLEKSGNAYSENNDVVPMPRDQFSLYPWGIVMHYPASQLAHFSGRAGAYAFYWYELADTYEASVINALSEHEDVLPNSLPGLAFGLGDDIADIIDRCGLKKEPDYTPDHLVYVFESADMRGFSFLTDRNDPQGQGAVASIRAERLNYQGLQTGVATQASCEALLGEADALEVIDASLAYDLWLQPGTTLWYIAEENRLGFHFSNEILDCIILERIK